MASPEERDHSRVVRLETRRLEQLTDGVFAIAMTIMVVTIDIQAPEEIGSTGALLDTLVNMRMVFFNYAIGFMVLAFLWIGNVHRLSLLEQTDRRHMWLSMAGLFLVTMVPFTADLLGDLPGYSVAEMLFHANILAVQLVNWFQWEYSIRDYRLVVKDVPPSLIAYTRKSGAFQLGIPVLAMGVTLFSPAWSTTVYLLIPVRAFFIRRLSRE